MAASLNLVPSQHLTLTPQMRQTLQVLQLSTLELSQKISDALEDNPLLEICESSEETFENNASEGDQELYWNAEGDDPEEWETPAEKTLSSHLLEQAGCLPLSEKDSGLLRWLIGCLDNDGFLPESLEEIAQSAPFQEEADPEDWRIALSLLQSFDPPGIGAKDVSDSLLLQLKHLLNRKLLAPELAKLTEETLRDHLTLVAKHRYDELKNKLSCSSEEIKSVLEVIGRLTPRPAAEFSADKINFVIPEVAVAKIQGHWTVRLISRSGSKIRLNDSYAQAVVQSKDNETMQLWKGRLTEARELLHSIEQREKTLLKVARAILAHQEAFFDKGPSALRPLVLRQIADETELHESTVSRACSGKYLICPLGVFELKYFFSSSVGPSDSGEAASAAAVKAALKRLVDQEPKAKPLSDAKIASALEQQGFSVARRTVAKYREALGIAPASERKNLD